MSFFELIAYSSWNINRKSPRGREMDSPEGDTASLDSTRSDEDDAISIDLSSAAIASPTFTVTDLLTSLGESTQDPDYLVTKGNDLVDLLAAYPYIKSDLVFSAFGHRLHTLLTHPKKEVVATGYRICRYVINDVDSIRSLMALRMDVFIIVSLSKGADHQIEREQALKLVRQFIDTPNGVYEITKGMVNSILAVAEQTDDKLRNICVETISELCLLRPELVSPQCLIDFVVDGPYELSPLVTTTLLALLNSPEGRSRVELADFLRLISPFTEFPVKGHINNEKLQNCAMILSLVLKTLPGLDGFCLDHGKPLRDLIQCLAYPVNNVVSKLLDLFLDVLLLKPMTKKNTGATSSQKIVLVPLKLENELLLNTQYLSCLLFIMFHCGIIENLLKVLNNSTDETNQTKATFLLTEIVNMAFSLIPEELINASMDQIDKYEDFIRENYKIAFMLEKLTRKSNRSRLSLGLNKLKSTSKSAKNNHRNYFQDSINFKTRLNLVVDDLILRQMIMDTKVVTSKNFSKWNCDLISEIFRGPLMNGKRLDDVNRTTKFLKRLLSFFRPFKRKFSNTKKTRHSVRFVKLGCDIIESLLLTPEGRRLLNDNKIVPQIAECLAQLDPFSGFYASDQIFSKQRLSTTLSYGYFSMLGVLSNNENGVRLLEKWKIFSIIYHISDNPYERDDVLILFMDEIKFTKSAGHSRILLSKFLNSDNFKLKTHTINLMSRMINEAEVPDLFVVDLLIDQLYQLDKEVVLKVVKVLNEFCKISDENVNHIIKKGPNVQILKLFGNQECENLILSLLSTDLGIECLKRQGLIEQEINIWTVGNKYIKYCKEVEYLISRTTSHKSRDLPPNFFGELVKTEEGFHLVIESGIMNDFINIIRDYSTILDNGIQEPGGVNLLKLKACLWSIGFISTSKLGIEALDVEGTIEDIVKIAGKSPFLDVKSCAFHVLGFVSSTYEGIEILDELGWRTKLDVYNQSILISIPSDISELFGSWNNPGSHIQDEETKFDLIDETDEGSHPKLRKLFKLVGNLCNHIFLNTSTKDLTALSKTHPELFEDPVIFYKVLGYLEVYKYRYTIRKMIIELFTVKGKVMETLVKRDRRRIKEIGK